MKIVCLLKLLWRKILTFEEAKVTFFHRNKRLISEKKYDYLFRKSHSNGTEMVYYESNTDCIYLKTKEDIIIATDCNYSVFIEVFIDKIYSLPLQMQKDFYVFDLGMNRGYSSLFFANMPKCKKVFGFELDEQTFEWAKKNLALNENLKDKITPHNFGLWNKDEEIATCHCSFDSITAIQSVASECSEIQKLQQNEKTEVQKAFVKQASPVFLEIFKNLSADIDKILKIDIEGAEYEVFDDMYNHNVLQQFDLIIGECHNGMNKLEKYLTDFECLYKSNETKLRADFCYINKRKKQTIDL